MSITEKFLEAKEELRKDLNEIRNEALKAATEKADARIDDFIDGVKCMITDISDEEFIELITSGKLDDEDLNAIIMFRSKARKVREEASEKVEERKEQPVHVIVLEI